MVKWRLEFDAEGTLGVRPTKLLRSFEARAMDVRWDQIKKRL